MGEILIDHSCLNSDKIEMRTEQCQHCQGVIAILKRGCNTFRISSIDTLDFIPKAHEAEESYVGKFRCSKCGNICRACADALEKTKQCPGHFRQQIDRFLARQQDRECRDGMLRSALSR